MQFSWNLKCEVMTLAGISTAKIKVAFLFFLLTTHGYGGPAFWDTWHTTVCLDLFGWMKPIDLYTELCLTTVIEHTPVVCGSITKSSRLTNNSTLETESISFSYYNFNYLTMNIQHGYSQWYRSPWPSSLNTIIVMSILDILREQINNLLAPLW